MMIKPLNVQAVDKKDEVKIKNNTSGNDKKIADSFPDWSIIPQNQLISRVKRNA